MKVGPNGLEKGVKGFKISKQMVESFYKIAKVANKMLIVTLVVGLILRELWIHARWLAVILNVLSILAMVNGGLVILLIYNMMSKLSKDQLSTIDQLNEIAMDQQVAINQLMKERYYLKQEMEFWKKKASGQKGNQ